MTKSQSANKHTTALQPYSETTMNTKDQNPYRINYIFHVQSAEDFYQKLQAFEKEHNLVDQTVNETTDLTLAQDMLKAIGVNI
jgi:hypothetical protein